jgi:hypothetical protein
VSRGMSRRILDRSENKGEGTVREGWQEREVSQRKATDGKKRAARSTELGKNLGKKGKEREGDNEPKTSQPSSSRSPSAASTQ